MSKLKFYCWIFFLLVLLGPFFIAGVVLGQFVGAAMAGYRTGRDKIRDTSQELKARLK